MFGSDDFKLESLDFLGDEAELRARARQELSDAGADDTHSGAIRIAMDRDGVVSDVDISRDWRDRLEPATFADALYNAYSAAVAKQLNAVALDAFAAQERGEAPFGDAGSTTVRAPVDNTDERVWLGSVWSILSDNDDRLHSLDRGERERIAAVGQTFTGPHGYLTIRFEGRGVTGISGDAELIGSADHEQLRVEALAVFRAAHQDSRQDDAREGN